MSRSLVIVESPTKVRTISKYLGPGYEVRSSMGHVRDLPERELGVDVEHGFRPEYTVLQGKEKVVRDLKAAGKQADTVYLATDPDREGEAIAWHVAEIMGIPTNKARRITFHEITRSAITHAIDNPHDIDMKKVDAQQARRVLDRLVGYQVSPLLWKTVRRGLSAGRVQSVALRMVCEREDAIEKFRPEEYWTIGVLLDNGQIAFEADLWKLDGKVAKISDEETAKSVVAEIRAQNYAIAGIETRRQKRRPAPPFITSTLQQEASRKVGMSPASTMRVAQQLYEGVEVGGEQVGLITYMRTDSTRIANEALDAARTYIGERFGAEYRPPRPNLYKSRESAQEAHEAIRPTMIDRPPEELEQFLTRDQLRLYRLIWNRFIASQMVPQELDVTTVVAHGGRVDLRASASVVAFDGFTRVYSEGRDEEQEEVEHPIPRELLAAWERAKGRPESESLLAGYAPKEVKPEQHFTKPPAHYTEAMLIKDLESEGIGRPSTYAQIVSTIVERDYVVKKEGRLQPTDLGRTVNRILVSQFPQLFNVEFTAKMEGELDRIEQGDDHWGAVLHEFYRDFERTLATAMANRAEIKKSTIEQSDEVCDKCGRPMVVRFGPRGKFLSCSGFPECRNAKPLGGEEPTSTEPVPDVPCPICGGPMVKRSGRYGQFLACENYPKCKGSRPIPTGVACPRPGCGGHLVVKSSRRGKAFYGCDAYPNCDVVYWDRPVPLDEKDPDSGLLFRLEKVARDGSAKLVPAQYPPAAGRRRRDGDGSADGGKPATERPARKAGKKPARKGRTARASRSAPAE